jgi:hypothetical protein
MATAELTSGKHERTFACVTDFAPSDRDWQEMDAAVALTSQGHPGHAM